MNGRTVSIGGGDRAPRDASATAVIEVFADVMCPFTHVGLTRLVERRRALGSSVVLRVRAWPLELVNGEPLGAELVAEEVHELREQVAPDLFTGFDASRFPSSSLPALTLAAAAYRASSRLGERVSLAVRHALFEEGRDIADVDVLADIARACDVPRVEGIDRDAVRSDWEEGRNRGVQGSPHFFLGDEGYFCPALDITRVGGNLHITSDAAAFDAFVARAFAEPHDARS
jgi:predicted DsbA family dithiol-disulfide isomerase